MRKSKIKNERGLRGKGQGVSLNLNPYRLPLTPKLFIILLFAFCILNLTGCLVRTYQVTKERVDQDLASGNRGYLKGEAPQSTVEAERKLTRTLQVIEVELNSPIKFEKKAKPKPQEEEKVAAAETEDKQVWGNRGFISESQEPEIIEPALSPVKLEKYTVQKGDTLQKISQKFYGTTKKWNKIYQANKEVLKGPNKIYPGQVINIPTEGLRETQENLK